jgi:hypothetical protein
MSVRIVELWRYPVKGLGGESLREVEVTKTGGLKGDRRFALAHETSACDPTRPSWKPKAEFLQLNRDPGIAHLQAKWNARAEILTLEADFGRGASLSGSPGVARDRVVLEEFIATRAEAPRRPGGRLVEQEGTTFSDTGRPVVSIVSLATLSALGEAAGASLDPRRFRGNLVIEGAEPWEEFDWIGRKMWAGSVLLRPVERIGRCAATSVDPETGAVAPDVPQLLRDRFGHCDCGVYAEIVTSGRISVGNSFVPAPS